MIIIRNDSRLKCSVISFWTPPPAVVVALPLVFVPHPSPALCNMARPKILKTNSPFSSERSRIEQHRRVVETERGERTRETRK